MTAISKTKGKLKALFIRTEAICILWEKKRGRKERYTIKPSLKSENDFTFFIETPSEFGPNVRVKQLINLSFNKRLTTWVILPVSVLFYL